MLRSGLLHPQLVRVLASTGHTDRVCVSDAGLPLPLGVERVDLGWKPMQPRFLDVLAGVLDVLAIEGAVLAEEVRTRSPEMDDSIRSLLAAHGVPTPTYVPHTAFKAQLPQARAIVRSGEFTPYANVLLLAGCAY